MSSTSAWRPLRLAALLVVAAGCAQRAAATHAAGTDVTATHAAAPASGHLLTAPELLAIPHSAPDHRIAYGNDSSQFGELRLPAGAGPFPVAVLVHGGCWREFSAASSIAPVADALRADGIATWNIEYRRLNQPGGGWPGTYLDVGRAIDHLRGLAEPYHLDLGRVVVLGHSAGGHLAIWVAARRRLPATSPLYRPDPLPISGVVDLSGAPDMAYPMPSLPTACGEDVVLAMLGGTPQTVPERYAQVSAIDMLPLGVPQALIWGALDDQVPLSLAERYVAAARKAGDRVQFVVDSTAGHFEPASPRSRLWPAVHGAVRGLLEGRVVR